MKRYDNFRSVRPHQSINVTPCKFDFDECFSEVLGDDLSFGVSDDGAIDEMFQLLRSEQVPVRLIAVQILLSISKSSDGAQDLLRSPHATSLFFVVSDPFVGLSIVETLLNLSKHASFRDILLSDRYALDAYFRAINDEDVVWGSKIIASIGNALRHSDSVIDEVATVRYLSRKVLTSLRRKCFKVHSGLTDCDDIDAIDAYTENSSYGTNVAAAAGTTDAAVGVPRHHVVVIAADAAPKPMSRRRRTPSPYRRTRGPTDPAAGWAAKGDRDKGEAPSFGGTNSDARLLFRLLANLFSMGLDGKAVWTFDELSGLWARQLHVILNHYFSAPTPDRQQYDDNALRTEVCTADDSISAAAASAMLNFLLLVIATMESETEIAATRQVTDLNSTEVMQDSSEGTLGTLTVAGILPAVVGNNRATVARQSQLSSASLLQSVLGASDACCAQLISTVAIHSNSHSTFELLGKFRDIFQALEAYLTSGYDLLIAGECETREQSAAASAAAVAHHCRRSGLHLDSFLQPKEEANNSSLECGKSPPSKPMLGMEDKRSQGSTHKGILVDYYYYYNADPADCIEEGGECEWGTNLSWSSLQQRSAAGRDGNRESSATNRNSLDVTATEITRVPVTAEPKS